MYCNESFQKDQVVCTFYGTLVYIDMINFPSGKRIYGNGVMGVRPEEVNKYGKKVFIYGTGEQFKNLPNVYGKQYVTIVPSKFCIGRYLIHEHAEKEGNLKLYETVNRIGELNQLIRHSVVQVRAKDWIKAGDEIFMTSTMDMQVIEL